MIFTNLRHLFAHNITLLVFREAAVTKHCNELTRVTNKKGWFDVEHFQTKIEDAPF